MKTTLGRSLMAMAGAILLAWGCATAPTARILDEAAVRAVLDGYARAVSTGDVELCRQLCAGEPAGTPAVSFARPVSATTANILNSRLALDVDMVLTYGDWSIARGTYTLTTNARGALPASAEFMSVLERQPDGAWKIAEVRHGSLLAASFENNMP